jgi:hypothetical protein
MRYFVVTYLHRATGATDEIVAISKTLRNKDLDTGSVILDFKTRAVLKSSVGDQSAPKNWDRIRDFYHQHYADVIDRLEKEQTNSAKK